MADETWTGYEFELSKCLRCIHWQGKGTCTAFPEGVPLDIAANDFDHEKPYDGDGGIRFTPFPAA